MDKNYVSLDALKEYDKYIKLYIAMHDGILENEETECPKCGAVITSSVCENCGTDFSNFLGA